MHIVEASQAPQKRRRGAPLGNRNAVTHGRRTARAVAARAAERALILDTFPKPKTRARGKKFSEETSGVGCTPSPIPTNEPNNAANVGATSRARKKRRGQKGNANALKHGVRSAGMRRRRRETDRLIAEAKRVVAMVNDIVRQREIAKQLCKALREAATSDRL